MTSLLSPDNPLAACSDDSFDVDWVISYHYENKETWKAVEDYRNLISQLERRNLETTVRYGYDSSLLVFVRIPRNILGHEMHRSRVKDWLHGVTTVLPLEDKNAIVKSETPIEEIRSIFHLVTWQVEQGGAGAGVTDDEDAGGIKASFAPHSPESNRSLLNRLARKTVLDAEDLDSIRALFGEKVAFYYAFIQCYSLFLTIPATCGVLFWLYGSAYSIPFAVINCLWGLVFVEYWKTQEIDLSLRWGVKGVGALKVNRPQYVWDLIVTDPHTGESHKVFPTRKRLLRQIWFLPFAALAGLALGTLVIAMFSLEIFLTEVYEGDYKDFLAFLPTILFATFQTRITSYLTSIAERLTVYENYRTQDEHDLSRTQKDFVLSFITSFLPTLLTAFIYVPMGAKVLPSLDALRISTIGGSSSTDHQPRSFEVDPVRLQQEVIYLSMTAQLINFGEEVVLPYLKRSLWHQYQSRKLRQSYTSLRQRANSQHSETLMGDVPEEGSFLNRIRQESESEPYNVEEDIVEMCVQYGYLILFGTVWPLVPLGFLANNWLELRGDFFKLIAESQRPPPIRTDSIGQSVVALDFLSWLGTLCTAALVHLYRNDIHEVNPSSLLVAVFIAEQAYLFSKNIIQGIFAKIGSEAVRSEKAHQYITRKRYLTTVSQEMAELAKHRKEEDAAASVAGQPHHYHHEEGKTTGLEMTEKQTGHRPGSSASTSRTLVLDTGEHKTTYSSRLAKRFWTERCAGISTADAGERLIRGLAAAQPTSPTFGIIRRFTDLRPDSPTTDKSKRT